MIRWIKLFYSNTTLNSCRIVVVAVGIS
jgi:hypothetical protein